jgi:hypothetical protein
MPSISTQPKLSSGISFDKALTFNTKVLPSPELFACLIQHTEAGKQYLIGPPAKAHEEVVRLDISVNKTLGMHILHSVDLSGKYGVNPAILESQNLDVAQHKTAMVTFQKEMEIQQLLILDCLPLSGQLTSHKNQ